MKSLILILSMLVSFNASAEQDTELLCKFLSQFCVVGTPFPCAVIVQAPEGRVQEIIDQHEEFCARPARIAAVSAIVSTLLLNNDE